MFVAVWPDEETRRRLTALQLGPTDKLRMVKPEQWHVTLRFLGEVNEALVPEFVRALDGVGGRIKKPVRCHLGPATAWFDRGRVLQIPAAGLDELARVVHQVTASVPCVARGEPRFNGHLTVARPRGRGPDAESAKGMAAIPFDATCDVASFDLVFSQPTPKGHHYMSLSRFPLR